MRSFLAGAVTGVFVSGVGLGVASLMAPQPAGNTPPEPPQTAAPMAAPSAADGPGPEGADGPGPEGADGPGPEGAQMPAVAAPGPGQTRTPQPGVAPNPGPTGGAPQIDTDPASIPETGAAPEVGTAPAAPTTQPAPATDTPVFPVPQAREPQLPAPEGDISISTDPAQPATPSSEDSAFIVLDDSALTPIPEPDTDTGPQIQMADPAPQTATFGTQQLTDAVPVRRTDSAPAPQETAPTVPPIQAFAAAFTADGRPLVALVMIDSAQFGLGPSALGDLPGPITIAIRASAPDAADRAAGYRAAGHEVLLLSDLPDGAAATDAAVALEAGYALLPETIGLLDAGLGGMANDRDLISVAMDRLSADGRGFVALDTGLGGALRAAQSADVPQVGIQLDLDGKEQTAQTIRRFLDQAAFKARQSGQIAVLGRMRPDTISALALWSLASRGAQVQIAPISALLLAEE